MTLLRAANLLRGLSLLAGTIASTALAVPTGTLSAPADRTTDRANASFDSLKTLVGRWRAQRPGGRIVEIVYRLTAGGTVLVETSALAPGRESMTVYHRDGPDLLATHFCPIGNQPRLRLVSVDPRRPRFKFKDATDLSPGESHQHAFGLDLIGTDRIVRTEIYREGRRDEAETLIFDRVPS